MKTKLLLVYGYVIPILTSVAASCLPMLLKFDYSQIAVFYSANQELLLGFFIGIVAIAYPFQSSLINEDNEHVLTVLDKSKVRQVFLHASMFQAMLILGLILIILTLSVLQNQSNQIGFLQMLASLLITFETMALISNGRAYCEIREKIIVEVSKAESKNQLTK